VRWRNQSYVVLGARIFFFCIFWSRFAKSLFKKKGKGTDSHLSDGDPFEKKLNAHGVKRCLLKKETNSHLSDGDPFEKKLNAHGVKKDLLKKGGRTRIWAMAIRLRKG